MKPQLIIGLLLLIAAIIAIAVYLMQSPSQPKMQTTQPSSQYRP